MPSFSRKNNHLYFRAKPLRRKIQNQRILTSQYSKIRKLLRLWPNSSSKPFSKMIQNNSNNKPSKMQWQEAVWVHKNLNSNNLQLPVHRLLLTKRSHQNHSSKHPLPDHWLIRTDYWLIRTVRTLKSFSYNNPPPNHRSILILWVLKHPNSN